MHLPAWTLRFYYRANYLEFTGPIAGVAAPGRTVPSTYFGEGSLAAQQFIGTSLVPATRTKTFFISVPTWPLSVSRGFKSL